MTFPTIAPTSRSFGGGDFPIKTFTSNSGKQLRILYGNRRSNRTIELTYENVTDDQAYEFIDDYDQQTGTFQQINFTQAQEDAIFSGWTAAQRQQILGRPEIQWRYAEAPQITAVRRGRSTVTVRLVGVV